MTLNRKLSMCLFFLRITIFLVMLMWTLDKLLMPAHAVAVYSTFYFIKGLSHTIMMIIGIAELFLIAGFLLGIAKFWTYGLVLVFHFISTVSSYNFYFDPFSKNLLFFAAWPMLAGCFSLFVLRNHDTFLAFGKKGD